MEHINRFITRTTILALAASAGFAISSHANAECIFTNTCFGENALASNTTGFGNSAFGKNALLANTIGAWNTATGFEALISNISGFSNTANGAFALGSNKTGTSNTASGFNALGQNTTGTGNSAFGVDALVSNGAGHNNTASGVLALARNTVGDTNTANGYLALSGNVTGDDNTASGAHALERNHLGNSNTAMGVNALFNNTSGFANTASGQGALTNSTTGDRNVALGYQAGLGVMTGSDNILIGAANRGKAVDNGIIRIGISAHQKKAFVAGIRGVTTGLAGATTVYIDANGQLGTIQSSRELKEDIQEMGTVSERLLALRPVTFRYREPFEDGSKPIQFGLIAEEVAAVFPEIVVYDEDGKAESVGYHLLATLILNEFQKERRAFAVQAARIEVLERESDELARLKLEFARMTEMIERLQQTQLVAARN